MNGSIAKDRMRRTVKLIERYRLLLKEAGVPDEISQDIQNVCRFLNNQNSEEITKILKQTKAPKKEIPKTALSKVEDLELSEIFKILKSEGTTRKELEALAVGRFGVPRGSLSSFSNLPLLREKIFTLARNEQAHNTITEVAKHTRV